jgi:hypothetical protein
MGELSRGSESGPGPGFKFQMSRCQPEPDSVSGDRDRDSDPYSRQLESWPGNRDSSPDCRGGADTVTGIMINRQ